MFCYAKKLNIRELKGKSIYFDQKQPDLRLKWSTLRIVQPVCCQASFCPAERSWLQQQVILAAVCRCARVCVCWNRRLPDWARCKPPGPQLSQLHACIFHHPPPVCQHVPGLCACVCVFVNFPRGALKGQKKDENNMNDSWFRVLGKDYFHCHLMVSRIRLQITIFVGDPDTLVDDRISIFFVNYGISVSASTAVSLSF